MYELKEKESLFRIEKYELRRDDGNLSVEIQEAIAGKSAHKFYAIPTFLNHRCDQEDYWGVGASRDEALKDCLKRIKNVPNQVICPAPGS